MLLRKKEEIETWLNKYEIKKYELIEDEKYGYVVNVKGNVDLFNCNLKSVDVKFNIINGYYNISFNNLESLEGSPEIIKKDMFVHNNKLTTLKYAPKIIKGNLLCSHNELESLEGCPKFVSAIYAEKNNLTIEGLKYLKEDIKIENNYIKLFFNKELNIFEEIMDFKILKEKLEEILKIKEEKEILLNLINKEDLIKNKNVNKM